MFRITIYILLGLLFWSCDRTSTELQTDKEIILLRKIGHEIMRYTGDSTMSINPIVQLGHRNYQLDFKMPFGFISDTIINIIDREIRHVSTDEYIVKVNSCSLDELVFSYFISPVSNDDLLSCLGRKQEEDCYNIQLSFIDQKRNLLWPSIAIGSVLFILVFVLKYVYQKGKSTSVQKAEKIDLEEDSSKLSDSSTFNFNYEEQVINSGQEKIPLTYKEAKIFKILNDHINEVVTREMLLKEVWEDEGLMVSRSLDMFISKLRKKLKADSSVQIINIHGIGYKLIST